ADAEAKSFSLSDVGGPHARDAANIDRGEVDLSPEGDRCEDRQLVRRVDALDVEGRIGLGIAERLRLGEDLAEVAPGPLHRREDVIAGPVEDAVDALDAVGRGAFAQALDDRYPARHRGF